MTRFFFNAHWPMPYVVVAASLLGGLAWTLYQRELVGVKSRLAGLPPLLRAAAIVLLVLMLAGPTLQIKQTTGRLAPLLLVVDGSQSMGLEDIDSLSKTATFSRLSRLGSHLFYGESESLLAKLHSRFDVRLLLLDAGGLNPMWSSAEGLEAAPKGFPDATGESTDLHQTLFQTLNASPVIGRLPPQSTVILFSDGQHNSGPSPLELTSDFDHSGVSVFTVGFGSEKPPPDLAIQRVEAPARAHPGDRLHGKIHITDDMPPGLPFEVVISFPGTEVWRKTFQTNALRDKVIPFEFPLKAFAEPAAGDPSPSRAQRLTATVEIPALAQEARTTNNRTTFPVRLASTKRGMLLIDGRPRWETRYLRSFFERNPQWMVNALLPSAPTGAQPFPRGNRAGEFPVSQKDLNEYDVILLGECPRNTFRDEELRWLSEFVSERGGTLILLDGPRGDFQSLENTPLATAFPVRLLPPESRAATLAPGRHQLVPVGRAPQLPAFSLTNERGESIPSQAEAWLQLAAPRRISPSQPLPGSEVLLEAAGGGERLPLLVFRSFGAGRVLYSASDETWRWRIRVGGLHQERFWNQITDWLTEEPFMVENSAAALDCGDSFYKPGAAVRLRARLRGTPSAPSPDRPGLNAQLLRNGSLFASFALTPDAIHGSTYEARTQPLPPGHYAFRLSDSSIPAEAGELSADFEVETPLGTEQKITHQNAALLQKLAADFHGKYLPESDINRLPEELIPRGQGEILERQIPIWSSFPCFFAVVFLLGVEWILRKRLGVV